MYDTIKILHSYWAYLVLLVLVLATYNALVKFLGKKEFQAKDFRISLFALIVSHIQLLLGIVYFFVSDYLRTIKEIGMATIMRTAEWCSKIIEYTFAMILAVVFITVSYSKHKNHLSSKRIFKYLPIFYTLALVCI